MGITDKGNSKYKGPDVGRYLACSDKNKEASLIGLDMVMLRLSDILRTLYFTLMGNHWKLISQRVTSDFILQKQSGSTLFGSILK